MTDAAEQITIDIYSDVMCPWCAIGYGQLQRALGQLGGEVEAEIRWRPFELNPDMAKCGEDQASHLQRKYRRPPEEGQAIRDQMRSIADEAGVSLAYEGEGEAPPAMMWNTRDAHKLLTWALEQAGPQVQTDLKLALFRAHFNERRNISEHTVLLDIAASCGLHREAAKAALADDGLEARVVAEERQAWDLNISGVPAMIIDQKFMVPGAQTPDTYVNAIRRVISRREVPRPGQAAG